MVVSIAFLVTVETLVSFQLIWKFRLAAQCWSAVLAEMETKQLQQNEQQRFEPKTFSTIAKENNEQITKSNLVALKQNFCLFFMNRDNKVCCKANFQSVSVSKRTNFRRKFILNWIEMCALLNFDCLKFYQLGKFHRLEVSLKGI